jgi:hypothetical protein
MWSLFALTCTVWLTALTSLPSHGAYNIARDYSGSSFFSDWDFYGTYDNLTNGDVIYLDQADAMSQKLAYVTSQGTAIIKVDNTTDVPYNIKRNSVRISSKDGYPVGSLWIIDAIHMPYGCSVWPSVWTSGYPWPKNGEIDIIEGVNLMTNNQMAIHTASGCTKSNVSTQTGTTGVTDCSQSAGCTVSETKANSYGSSFAQSGGGVFAAQFDATGIYIWFWSRANVPAAITQSTSSSSIDISTWGNPSAAYAASSCNIGQYFGVQNLIVDITLCGDWAGNAAVYNATCSNTGSTGQCTADNVFGAGNPRYDNAYFEFNYIRGYTLDGVSLSSSSSSTASSTAGAKSTSSSSSAEWSRRVSDLVLYTSTALVLTVSFYIA